MNVKAYTLGCLSICFQQDKDLEVRNMGLKLMHSASQKSQETQQAFGAGRLDTAVAVSKRRTRIAEKGGNSAARKRPRS